MPVDELFLFQEVSLRKSLAQILSRPGYRVDCDQCGEEIINEREIHREEMTLCRTCAGDSYYELRTTLLRTALQKTQLGENGQLR
jgi:formylmethanofuran dehydrogenase subunit E